MRPAPRRGLTSSADGQARAIGEGFADALAVGYLHDLGYAPADDEDPFAVGAYVSGNGSRGIRNYSMAASPLNYSDVQGYDGSGAGGPHDDGEIWAAVNYEIRQALVAKYPHGRPPTLDRARLRRASGRARNGDHGPGARRVPRRRGGR